MFSALVFSWFLSFGYVPIQSNCIGDTLSGLDSSRIATVVEIGMSVNFYRLGVYGSIENYQYVGEGGYFYPFRADYKAGASLRITDHVKIIAEHECDHPVVFSNNTKLQSTYMSAETRVMVRIEGGGK